MRKLDALTKSIGEADKDAFWVIRAKVIRLKKFISAQNARYVGVGGDGEGLVENGQAGGFGLAHVEGVREFTCTPSTEGLLIKGTARNSEGEIIFYSNFTPFAKLVLKTGGHKWEGDTSKLPPWVVEAVERAV